MKYLRIAAWLVIAILSALSFAVLLSPTHYELAGVKFEVSLYPLLKGGTEIVLPPVGSVKAATHQVPFQLKAKVEGINQGYLEKVLKDSTTTEDYFDLLNRDARRHALNFFLKLIAIAALGGLIGSLFFTRAWWRLLIGSSSGIIAVALLMAGLYLQYDVTAFTQPEFSGSLNSARWIAASIERKQNPIDTLKQDIQLVGRNLANFASKVDAWEPISPEKGTIRVLAVSDIHNNPAAFTLIKRVAHDFQVDLVIDTGDITDFGTPIEANLLNELASFQKPYLFIPGNHDSPAVVETMRSLPPVKVLDGQAIDIKGMKVFGKADPVSGVEKVKPVSGKEMKKLATKIKRQVDSMSRKPLIAAVHDPRMSKKLVNKVPIVLQGHTHKASIEEVGDTTFINPGTTGASGLRLFNNGQSQKQKYTVSLLYIDPGKRKLIAVDSIEVTGLEGEFVLKRRLVQKEETSGL
jgi:putative phosphoesterase